MARKIKKRKVIKKSVLIAFEDTKSAKYYFVDLLRDKNLTGQVVLVKKDKGQDPKRVIEKIDEYKRENSHENFEYSWIVIDRDDWTKDKYLGAIEKARNQNICVAFSNDAYELWILLHFEEISRYTHRKELNRKLNKIFLERFGKEYAKANSDIYKLTIEQQKDAIVNAKKLRDKSIRDYGNINPEQNPLTMIFELVECLNSLYESNRTCSCFPN
jgi:predicted secreted protein